MSTKRLILANVLLLLATAVTADPADSLLHLFDRKPTARVGNQFFDILRHGGLIDEPITLTDQMTADSLRQQVWYWAAEYYYAAQDYEQSVRYGERALPLFHIPDETADCLNLLAISHVRQAQFSEAAAYAKRCYELDRQSGDPNRISSSLNTLSSIYLSAGQPQEAEKYVLRGIRLARKTSNSMRLAVLCGMASEVYHALGQDTTALRYVDEAYLLDSIGERTHRMQTRLAQKASVLIGLQHYAEAEQTLREVIPYLRHIGDRHSLGISLNKLGKALLCQGREEEAVPCYQEAAAIFQQQGDPYNEIHSRRELYEALWQTSPEEARYQFYRFNELKDSIYDHASAESLARYNAEFGNDWLTLENHAQRQGKLWAIIIAALIALVAMAIGLWMHRRNRRQVRLNEKLRAILAELREEQDKKQAENKTKDGDEPFMDKVAAIVNEQIGMGQVDVKTLAERMGMSPYKFRTELTKNTDETVQNLIQRIRMERASHLLDTRPDLSIQEVAYLCGFSEPANFTRAFKKYTGHTPTENRLG